jgi:hypothetical protein
MKIFTALLTCLSVYASFAQNSSIQNDKCFGGSLEDVFNGQISLSDGRHVLFGYSKSNISGTKTENGFGGMDGWIILLDQNNNEVWQKTIGGNYTDFFSKGIQLTNGNICLLGTSESSASGNKTSVSNGGTDAWLIQLDLNGNILLDKSFGGLDSDNGGGSIIEGNDGSIYLFCSSFSGISGNKTEPNIGMSDIWLLKCDTAGNIVQQKTIGGTATDYIWNVIQDDNLNFIVAAQSSSGINGDKTESNIGLQDFWVLKIDTNFQLINQKTIGGTSSDYPNCMLLKNGNIIIVGNSDSNASGNKTESSYGWSDYWLVELTANFEIIREKTIGSDFDDYGCSAHLLPNGNLFVCGYSDSPSNEFKSQNNIGGRDVWFFLLDDNWNIIYDRTMGSTGSESGCIASVSDLSNFSIFCNSNGAANNDKTCPTNGQIDFWVLSLSSDLTVDENLSNQLFIFPNPASETLTISLPEKTSNTDCILFDNLGKEVKRFMVTGGENMEDISELESGIYLIRLGERIKKITKQ